MDCAINPQGKILEVAGRINPDVAASFTAAGNLVITNLDPSDAEGDSISAATHYFPDPEGPAVKLPAADLLAEAKTRAAWEVDQLAEAIRQKVLTPGAGQAMAYQEKKAEAEALQTDADPDPANYPFLSAEVGVTVSFATGQPAADIGEVAVVVLALAAAWKPFGAAVENVRLAAKGAIDAAATTAEIDAVLAGLAWPEAPAA